MYLQGFGYYFSQIYCSPTKYQQFHELILLSRSRCTLHQLQLQHFFFHVHCESTRPNLKNTAGEHINSPQDRHGSQLQIKLINSKCINSNFYLFFFMYYYLPRVGTLITHSQVPTWHTQSEQFIHQVGLSQKKYF